MVHYHGVGATATMPGFEDKYYYGNRPNTLYFPRFRNLGGEESKLDFVRGYGYQSMAMPIAWSSYWHRVPGFGADFKRAMRKPGPWFIFLEGFGEHLPYADNRITLERATDRFGVPQLRFEVTFRENERRMGADILRQSVDMLTAAGATNINPLPEPAVPGTSIHEYGGARMGADPRESVVNAFNQAHDAPNLFITDGAMHELQLVRESLTHVHGADGACRRLRRRATARGSSDSTTWPWSSRCVLSSANHQHAWRDAHEIAARLDEACVHGQHRPADGQSQLCGRARAACRPRT